MLKTLKKIIAKPAHSLLVAAAIALPSLAFAETAYLQITLKIDAKDRPAAGSVYAKFKQPFLTQVPGAKSKELLMRDADVQVLHSFDNEKQAQAYLSSALFTKDVVEGLKPLLKSDPEIRVYSVK
jgi:hypothetical protein